MSSTPPVTLTGLCLQYLLLLRAVTIGGLLIALIVAYDAMEISPPIVPIALLITCLSIFTMFSWGRIQSAQVVSDKTLLIQLVVDLVGLTVLLLLTGGPPNPFASLLLLPVIVAASMIRTAYTWLVTALAAFCYSALMLIHIHFPLAHIHTPVAGLDSSDFLHMWGMWIGFILSAVVVAFFIARMGSTLRAHDLELAAAREKALQTNQLAALGTLAAGTAHELGTPLATMAVLTKELARECHDDPAMARQLQLLREQIDRCKEILARMSDRAGQAQANAGHRVSIEHYLQEILGEWRKLRPETPLQILCTGSRPVPDIVADRTLTQAILNILNNAADAATNAVGFRARWQRNHLHVQISDDGPGIPEDFRKHIGKPFVTTKPPGKGMGLGLYLARTTLERLGGHLDLCEGTRSGTCVKIDLPLTMLLAADP